MELNEDTKRANESIENSASSIQKQNSLIAITQEKFKKVDKEVTNLLQYIKDTEQSIHGILNATSTISDNITHLSATSQEVAASSNEGLRTSDTTVENMTRTREILENIYQLAQDLKQSI